MNVENTNRRKIKEASNYFVKEIKMNEAIRHDIFFIREFLWYYIEHQKTLNLRCGIMNTNE